MRSTSSTAAGPPPATVSRRSALDRSYQRLVATRSLENQIAKASDISTTCRENIWVTRREFIMSPLLKVFQWARYGVGRRHPHHPNGYQFFLELVSPSLPRSGPGRGMGRPTPAPLGVTAIGRDSSSQKYSRYSNPRNHVRCRACRVAATAGPVGLSRQCKASVSRRAYLPTLRARRGFRACPVLGRERQKAPIGSGFFV